jgi:diaminopimelate decarboxylase
VKPESWLGPRRAARLAERYGTPAYVYSARVLRNHCRALVRAFPGVSLRYAMKANANPSLLRMIRGQRLGVDTVSAWEVALARECGFRPRDIVYSGSNPTDEELEAVHKAGVLANLDALSSLRRYGKLHRGAPVSLRLNLDIGGGHHPHVVTAGPDSKFGLAPEELPEARALIARYGLKLVGLHQHIGSGVFDLPLWMEAFEALLELAGAVPGVQIVDAGGGFGVPYRPDESPIDLPVWGRTITARMARFNAARKKKARLVLEPGRYVVCEAGVLLARVTTVKRTRDRVFVGVDSGMHHLVRPGDVPGLAPGGELPPPRRPEGAGVCRRPHLRERRRAGRGAHDGGPARGRPGGGGQRGGVRLRDGLALQPPGPPRGGARRRRPRPPRAQARELP